MSGMTEKRKQTAVSSETSGMICTVISAVLFGTMPLMAKAAYAMGSNAYTVAFGRFSTGALFSGLFLLLRQRQRGVQASAEERQPGERVVSAVGQNRNRAASADKQDMDRAASADKQDMDGAASADKQDMDREVSASGQIMNGNSMISISRAQLKSIALLSVFFSAMPCLLYGSYRYIDSGMATTLHFTYPIVVTLLSVLVFHSRISRRTVLCVLLCLAGIFCLGSSQGGTDVRGMLLAAGSGVVYSVYIIGVDRSGLRSLPVLLIIFWLSVFSAAEVLVFSLCTGQFLVDLPWQVWIPYTGLGLVAMVIAASLFQLGILRCGPVKSSMLSTVEPVTGVLIGALVFHETLTIQKTAGIALILGTVLFDSLHEH